MPNRLPTGSSPMMAPTTLAVAEIRSAVNRYGQRRREAELQEDLAGRRGQRAHEGQRVRIGRAKPAQHVDRHREEGQVRGDHRLGHPRRAEPDDDHRRDGEDRHRLRHHHVRQEAALEQPEARKEDGQAEARRRPEREADHALERRVPGIVGHDEEPRRAVGALAQELPEDLVDVREHVARDGEHRLAPLPQEEEGPAHREGREPPPSRRRAGESAPCETRGALTLRPVRPDPPGSARPPAPGRPPRSTPWAG